MFFKMKLKTPEVCAKCLAKENLRPFEFQRDFILSEQLVDTSHKVKSYEVKTVNTYETQTLKLKGKYYVCEDCFEEDWDKVKTARYFCIASIALIVIAIIFRSFLLGLTVLIPLVLYFVFNAKRFLFFQLENKEIKKKWYEDKTHRDFFVRLIVENPKYGQLMKEINPSLDVYRGKKDSIFGYKVFGEISPLCPNCRRPITKSGDFCGKCGEKLI